jgi:hypothetical protein
VLPGNKVRIESFYSTSSPAAEAAVRVYRPDGALLLPPGATDDKGVYEFAWVKAEDLKVVVSQEGHRKELTIPASELFAVSPAVTPVADSNDRSHLAEILAGLSFILAAAAFFLSVRTASRVNKELTTKTRSDTKKNNENC